jgi:hypothetical protein
MLQRFASYRAARDSLTVAFAKNAREHAMHVNIAFTGQVEFERDAGLAVESLWEVIVINTSLKSLGPSAGLNSVLPPGTSTSGTSGTDSC